MAELVAPYTNVPPPCTGQTRLPARGLLHGMHCALCTGDFIEGVATQVMAV